jgi:hypothetical protein
MRKQLLDSGRSHGSRGRVKTKTRLLSSAGSTCTAPFLVLVGGYKLNIGGGYIQVEHMESKLLETKRSNHFRLKGQGESRRV